ncbi:hypothetical protein WJX74_004208 [Apatococcus lobatus]|uniref:SET domain-containing protein n=1 Tax=Apatococcus lobatus TaxID=904363 RepID=A0AAW1RJ39_9CHLO
MPAHISIAESPDRGRHLVADQIIPPGETFTAGQSLLRCSRCRLARYSSREAQLAAWKNGHRAECSALRACAPRMPPATIRLAGRVLWKSQVHDQHHEPEGGTYEELEQLHSHWSSLPDDRKQSFAQMAALTREYMDGAGDQAPNATQHDVRKIALLIARFACNNHTICDEELRPIGTGIYPKAALANHSCTPNAVQSFRGNRIIFRTVRQIRMGEEICISYLELTGTHAERRAALLSSYHFDIALQGLPDPAASLLTASVFQGKEVKCRIRIEMHTTAPCTTDETDGLKLGLEVVGKPLDISNGVMASLAHSAASTQRVRVEESFNLDAQDLGGAGPEDDDQQGSQVHVDVWGPYWTGGDARLEQAKRVADAAASLLLSQQQAEALLAAQDPEQGLRVATQASAAGALAAEPVLGGHHVLRMRLQEVLLRCAIACGAWPAALHAARSLAATYHLLYPPIWPNLGLHKAIHAKVAMHQQLPAEALEQGRAALLCLEQVQPGSQSLREIEGLCHQAQQELGPF